MSTDMQVEISNTTGRSSRFDANVERGMFLALADLIKIETNLVWDPLKAFFILTGGYQVHKYNTGGVVLDQDGQEIFLTDNHIDALFRIATMRAKQLSRHRSR